MNEILLTEDLRTLNNTLGHSGVAGMKWHRHLFGKWQPHAVYAGGKPDPNGERRAEKEKSKGRNDAKLDYSVDAKVNINRFGDYKKDLATEFRFAKRRPDDYPGLVAMIVKKNGGAKVSKEYYDEYMKTYNKLSEEYKDKLITPARKNTSVMRVG